MAFRFFKSKNRVERPTKHTLSLLKCREVGETRHGDTELFHFDNKKARHLAEGLRKQHLLLGIAAVVLVINNKQT